MGVLHRCKNKWQTGLLHNNIKSDLCHLVNFSHSWSNGCLTKWLPYLCMRKAGCPQNASYLTSNTNYYLIATIITHYYIILLVNGFRAHLRHMRYPTYRRDKLPCVLLVQWYALKKNRLFFSAQCVVTRCITS